jgi:hypothetical protein
MSLSDMRDKALATGANALIPVVSKVAGTVQELADGPVGKAVGTAASVGAHVASKTPVIGRFIGGHDGATNGSVATRPLPSESPASPTQKTKAPAKQRTVRTVGQTKPAPEPKAAEVSADVAAKAPGGSTPAEARSLPIAGYTKLSVAKITERLEGLTQTDLASLYRFEKANSARAGVLKALDKRMVQLPLPMYDSLTIPAILDDLNGLTKPELKVIRDYEVRTTNRLPVLERVDELLAVPLPGETPTPA